MPNNILICTTFKNSITLLKPFYSFYKDIWNPRQFCFFIGISDSSKIDIFHNDICKFLNITLTKTSYNFDDIPNAYNIKLYKGNQNINIVFYNTELEYNAGVWSNLRSNLFRLLHRFEEFNTFDYYLNTDNDDFFYVKDIANYLTNYNINNNSNHFHAIEFLSQNEFNVKNDFNFISHNYYFRLKSIIKQKLDNISSHLWCRKIYLNDKIRNEEHTGKHKDICNDFDNKLKNNKLNDINEFDRVCFSFGCLDLNFLIEDKHFLQTSNITEKYLNDKIKIEADFHNYYKLTEEEKRENIIINCNFLQKYFN
tara:strand:+ start:39 stop:968 length:930 start_codon:yes stop_codon:yes gene_type:complete